MVHMVGTVTQLYYNAVHGAAYGAADNSFSLFRLTDMSGAESSVNKLPVDVDKLTNGKFNNFRVTLNLIP